MSKIFQVNIGFTRQIGLSSFDKVGGFIAIEDGEDVCVELDKHAATLYGWLAKRNPHILDEGTVTIQTKEVDVAEPIKKRKIKKAKQIKLP